MHSTRFTLPGVALLLVAMTAAHSAGQAPPAELTTLLGKVVHARPDTDGAIAKADAALAAGPRNLDAILGAARARDAALQFHAAIIVYSLGIDLAPADVRFWRFRGHRYISIRQFDKAIADLTRAVELAPSSFDAAYHLGLAHYLAGHYDDAARVYRACLDGVAPAGTLPAGWRSCTTVKATPNDRVALSDWLYRALARSGKLSDARALADQTEPSWTVGENEAYFTALRFYRGAVTEQQAMAPTTARENRLVTVGYGIAVHHLVTGARDAACGLLRRIADEPNWNAFGVIAAEADLARRPAICPR